MGNPCQRSYLTTKTRHLPQNPVNGIKNLTGQDVPTHRDYAIINSMEMEEDESNNTKQKAIYETLQKEMRLRA